MSCLTLPEVVAFESGQLSGEALQLVERHLAGCDACVARVETQRLGQESTAPHQTLPHLSTAGPRISNATEVPGETSTAPGQTQPNMPLSTSMLRAPEVSAPGELPRGTVVGRYLIVERLGVGAMGAVYLAYDPGLDRRVALKLLRPEQTPGQAELMRARLVREAKAMARLAHPNVVAVYDAGAFGQRIFVAMEYMNGPTLERWLNEKPRGWREVLAKFTQAGRGLAAAHHAGLVHRDFKPENVLLAASGQVKVTDFGLAHLESRGVTSQPLPPGTVEIPAEASPMLTSPGSIIGTPAYMAPEQFRGQAADARTDQFNFCAALYEALYGVPPFGADDVAKIARRVMSGELPVPLADVDVPAWVSALVLRGLRANPADRHPSLEGLLDALVRDPAHARRKWFGAGLLAVGLLGAAGATVRWLYQERTRCRRDAEAEVAQIWSPALAEKVRAAASSPEKGDATAGELADFSTAWGAAKLETCVAERDRAISTSTANRRAQCLDVVASTAVGVVELLSKPDPKIRVRLEVMVQELRQPSTCAGLASEESAWRKQQLEFQPLATRGLLLMQLGRIDEAAELAEQVLAGARAHGNPVGEAQALELRAAIGLQREEHLDQALADDRECARLAQAASDDIQAAGCLVAAAQVAGVFLNRYDEAAELVLEARAEIARSGTEHLWDARLDRIEGNIAVNRGDPNGAKLLERALEKMRALNTHELPSMAWIYNDLGRAVGELEGDENRAAGLFERAAQLHLDAYGAEHPALVTFWQNAGEAEILAAQPAEALPLLDRARDVARLRQKELPSDLASVLAMRARALVALGRTAEAQRDLTDAAALEKGQDPDSSTQATEAVLWADLSLGKKDFDAAVRYGEQAVTLATQRPGEAEQLSAARFALARALESKDWPRARTLATQALEAYQKLHFPEARRQLAALQVWLRDNP